MLVKWWQCSNIAAFTAVLEHPIMESALILIEKTTDFIAPRSSPIFMSALLCDHSFVLKALCSTNWSSTSFCGQGLSPAGPCTPHNNTLKPSIRGHLAPGAELLSPLFDATHAHTQDIYHPLMTDSTKDDVTSLNTTTYNKRVTVPLSSQFDHSDLTWLKGLSLTGLFVPVRPPWYVTHEASMLPLLLLLLLMTKSE